MPPPTAETAVPPPALPPHLAERCRAIGPGTPVGGRFVLHWTHHALRIDENPALETAATLARAWGVGLVVHAGVAGSHPFANDRHTTFLLEGLRDLAADLGRRGIPFSFSSGLADDRGRLDRLAADASCIVTEDLPVEPFPRWSERIARRHGRTVWLVDTACVVPMNLSPRGFDRAFAYRDATERERRRRVPAAWPACPELAGTPWPTFVEASDAARVAGWSDRDIADLVARLDLDHAVGPVPETRGGAGAGLARWTAFRDGPLARYARDRNDAALSGPGGATSRLSAYLHYGMVSPLRIAREAHERGAAKFLDELLVWRELAYLWCRHEPRPERLAALPAWARHTLERHARDPRPVRHAWETLARGRTGERLWDLAQRSLLRHGELHNNLRMTWGKAIVGWTASPAEALDRLVDLNHRYALDGCDPSSYGGLLWCLGLFDRPFEPERAVLGSLRPRAIDEHAARLDLARYTRLVDRPERPWTVAVVGAGFAGLAAARTLADHGVAVTVFEKSRGTGGRAATRRIGDDAWPLGADAFVPRHAALARVVASWVEDGRVVACDRSIVTLGPDGEVVGRGRERSLVGRPGLSVLTRHLADGLDLRTGVRVAGIRPVGGRRALVGDDGASLGSFDLVLLALPAPQAATLLEGVSDGLAARAAAVPMRPTLVAGIADAPYHDADELRFADEPVLALARRCAAGWTVHASAEWSAARLEDEPIRWGRELAARFADRTGRAATEPTFAHRWRFAVPAVEGEVFPGGAALEADAGVGVAGDWCRGGSSVEDAYLSGVALAGRVLGLPVPAAEPLAATLFG